MINQFAQLEESIAEKIKDYQKDSNEWDLDDEHVDIWIKQFPQEEQGIVLAETNHLLERNYFKKDKIISFLEDIWNTEVIMGKQPYISIHNIQFLNIQKGNSQRRLVDLIEHYYFQNKGIKINRYDSLNINKYIYLDDCMFTGFTILKDITKWIESATPNRNSELIIILLGLYNGNYDYISGKLKDICAERGINVNIYREYEYNNNLKNMPPYDVIWPQCITDDEYVNWFIEDMDAKKEVSGKGGICFRNTMYDMGESDIFTSTYNRNIFEKALLKKGAYICSLPLNRNERMKPMGYNRGFSLGFGAFFATCYNISNNCPLAFWWGDMWKTEQETLGKWYPLLPREVHSNEG